MLLNFVKVINLKTYIFSIIPLNCCFRKLSERYWWNNFGLTKLKKKTEKSRNRKHCLNNGNVRKK